MVDELVGQAVEAGATVLLASHDLERAEAVATRTVVVRGGLVAEQVTHAG
jgi:ABC-type multidrug transport system ATPase subunit